MSNNSLTDKSIPELPRAVEDACNEYARELSLHFPVFIHEIVDTYKAHHEYMENGRDIKTLPKVFVFECDYLGNNKAVLLNVEECLNNNFHYNVIAKAIFDAANLYGEPHILSVMKYTQQDGCIVYSKPTVYSFEDAAYHVTEYINESLPRVLQESGCDTIEEAYIFFDKKFRKEKEEKTVESIKKIRQKEESNFEHELLSYLEENGFAPLRQVKSGNLRMDLLIPGQLIIELKSGKVNADDACQAIDYLASNSMDVLLVGTGLTSGATRGIESVNKISKDSQIMFVTRNACFRYLKAVLVKPS